jgi:CHAT domain-containing protein
MTNDDLVNQLIELVDSPNAAKSIVTNLEDEPLTAVTAGLKKQALFYLQRDASTALAIAELILNIAGWQDKPLIRALGLQTKATVLTLSQREYEKALDLFAESEALYQADHRELEIAIGQVSHIWALACLQRYDQAFATSEWTVQILTRHEAYRSLAALSNNLAAIYGRRGQDEEALERFLQAEAAYTRLGQEGHRRRPIALINKAIVLRNLGRFSESIAANEAGLLLATELHQTAIVARAEQNLGITYFLLGHINKAQALLQKARDTFISDRRYRDAILAELFLCDGLLYLRRFENVLEICRRVEETFREVGTQFEVAQALLNKATALTGLNADDEAFLALAAARHIFTHEQNEAWQMYTDLEEATLLFRRRKYAASERLAAGSISKLQTLNLPLKEAQALIIAARAALARNREAEAGDFIEQALDIARAIDAPILTYRGLYLQGQLALAQNDTVKALQAYEAAIRELERLQGQIMVEFRADFLSDKDEVYTAAVDLCLQANDPQLALSYTERAKSRALLSMLSHHVDLRIEAKSPADQQLVDQILLLREKRDRLYRRWETGETPGSTMNREEEQPSGQVARHRARNIILQTEDEIRTLWHRLLVSNAAYARDASLWQVQSQLEQEFLDKETLLVEFFTLPQGLVAFLISSTAVQAIHLPVTLQEINQLQQKLSHNFNTLKQVPHLADILTRKAQRILHDIYLALAAPWMEYAEKYDRLIIVPHGSLHYLPFHALYDGQEYLLQRFQMSYLPGSSFLSQARTTPGEPTRTLVMGHTQNGRLTNIPAEIETIAAALNTRPYLNKESTRSRFQEEAPNCQLIHVAAHGNYNAANPLFSGLYLQDGLLSTLDIFNIRLSASLVTLSACQTGRNVISGGDELFGLTRAFLTAGAASLILTLWPVEDRSTTFLMHTLYDKLLSGQPKIAALQNAQLNLISGEDGLPAKHPYYWAPFFLIGDSGPI